MFSNKAVTISFWLFNRPVLETLGIRKVTGGAESAMGMLVDDRPVIAVAQPPTVTTVSNVVIIICCFTNRSPE
jgi:hypothetical protein